MKQEEERRRPLGVDDQRAVLVGGRAAAVDALVSMGPGRGEDIEVFDPFAR